QPVGERFKHVAQPSRKRECEAGRTPVDQCEASRTLVEVLTDDQLMLEVIDKGAGSQAHPVPLLFVHGGWHSASCWANFLDFFAGAGYRAVALSLRGHGNSPTNKRFHRCSIADYVDDVAAIADDLDGRPVLVAHSL